MKAILNFNGPEYVSIGRINLVPMHVVESNPLETQVKNDLWARFRFDGLMKMKTATRPRLNVSKASKQVNGNSDYLMAA